MISIIIPTKNEPFVTKLTKKIEKIMRNNYEIIVVEATENLPRINSKNTKVVKQIGLGLGKAFLQGLKIARGDRIILMDGDGSHSPKFLPNLIKELNNYDIVIGSRFVRGGKNLDRTHRKILSFIFRKITSLILKLDIEDNMSGFAAFRKKVFCKIHLDPIGYKVVLEAAYKAHKKGLKIKEIPITFYPRKMGKSKTTILEGLKIILLIIRLRLSSL